MDLDLRLRLLGSEEGGKQTYPCHSGLNPEPAGWPERWYSIFAAILPSGEKLQTQMARHLLKATQ